MDREQLAGFYRRYIQCWNDRRLDELREYVADDVRVNDAEQDPERYVAGMEDVFSAFPDFHWDLRHLLIDGDWISAHFTVTGTHQGTFLGVPASGRAIVAQEFAVYLIGDGKIAEVWGATDHLTILNQLTV
ncbi:ester cyclase [Kribbella catacumbae]|uniref:ester cyclase n=1 Tax=Kribbella catacumbae TaxID=460086 RepID=UPI00037B8B58|nr:ester cyclase [Kribbella catacumbae]